MFEITTSTENKDVPRGMTTSDARDFYLNMHGDFKSKLPPPVLVPSPERGGLLVLDFAKGPAGLKAHGAEKFIATTESDLLGYAAPRVGHAPEAIAMLAESYGKKAVFFAAASKKITPHQAVVKAYKTSDLRFARIPAMPTMNAWIRQWAEKFNGSALPFGLANTPSVTAGLISMASQFDEPPEFYCAVSTGTMIRALSIAWPNSKPVGIAVARNMKGGEIGRAQVTSYHKGFYKPSDYMPEFNTTATYDAKAYKKFLDEAKPGSYFINVGSDAQIEHRLSQVDGWQNINADREWGDQGAFEYA